MIRVMALPPEAIAADRRAAEFHAVLRVDSITAPPGFEEGHMEMGLVRGRLESVTDNRPLLRRLGGGSAKPAVGELAEVEVMCWFWAGSGPPGEDRLVVGQGREPRLLEIWGRMRDGRISVLSFAVRG